MLVAPSIIYMDILGKWCKGCEVKMFSKSILVGYRWYHIKTLSYSLWRREISFLYIYVETKNHPTSKGEKDKQYFAFYNFHEECKNVEMQIREELRNIAPKST